MLIPLRPRRDPICTLSSPIVLHAAVGPAFGEGAREQQRGPSSCLWPLARVATPVIVHLSSPQVRLAPTSMIRLIVALGVFVLVGSAGSRASADTDCMCVRMTPSEDGCPVLSAAAAPNPEPRPVMWCEHADDPRCMPANTPSDLRSEFNSVFQGIVSDTPLESAREHRFVRGPMLARLTGDGMVRRVERPPR